MKRALIILIGALLLALAIATGTVVFLAATEGGTRFLAGQAERFLPIRFEDVSGALLREVQIGLLELELDGQTLRIEELAVAMQLNPLLFDNVLTIDSATARLVALSGEGAEDDDSPPPALELPFVPLDIDVAHAEVTRLDIEGAFPMSVRASAAWRGDSLSVRDLQLTSEVVNLAVEGRLGSDSNPRLDARVRWSLPGTEWEGEGVLDGRVNDLMVRHTLRGLVSGDAAGSASLADVTEPAVDLQVDLNPMVFGSVTLAGVHGSLSGTLANLNADVTGTLSVPELEPFNVAVQAYGPVTGPLTVRNVTADAVDGRQQAQGSVSWSEDVRVHLGGSFEELALAALREGLDGRLGGNFQFAYQDERLSLGLDGLSGTFEGRPVSGSLQAAQTEDGWRVEPLVLAVGSNSLTGSASLVGDHLALQGDVTAPSLQALKLGVAGDVAGRVRLSGVWPDLSGAAELRSGRLAAFDTELTSASVVLDMQDGVLEARVMAATVQRQQLALDDVTLTADGPLEDLSWRFTWAEGEGSGALRRRDDGFLLALNMARVQALDQVWTLSEPTRVLLLEQRVEVAPACITGGDAAACVESLVYADGRIETRGRLDRAPVGMLQAFLPVSLEDDGYLEGAWALAGEPAALSGEIDLAARDLAYLPQAEDAIELPDLEASGRMDSGRVAVRLAAQGEQFNVAGNATVQSLTADGALSGTLQVLASDLSALKVFDERIEQVSGVVEGDLILSGTLGAPRAEGRLRLDEGQLKLNDPDVALDAMSLRLRLDDSGTFDASGTARQQENEVRVTASGSGLFSDALVVNAALTGNGLKARHPDWEITVSPDLAFAYAEGRGRLRGKLEVPQAEVRLTTLPSSVPSPSEDVVVIGREETTGNGQGRLRADVDVVLGEDVVLKALGITAELEGTLRARVDAQGRTTLRGTLNVTGGVLSAQGQTLTIESGSVVYNGPVTRPYIDLRAVREIDDVTPTVKVGLHIRGDADNLTSSVFSDPAMSDTRALSFLILGRDLDQETSSDDSGQLMAAAINLGLARSKGITAELMRRTGLDELSASAESSESFAIIAGKRVTDQLYVRYTYDTLSSVGIFLVRYELTDRWQLEAQSGEESAMDLMYSVEK